MPDAQRDVEGAVEDMDGRDKGEEAAIRLLTTCIPWEHRLCVGTLPDGYVRTYLLPQVPTRQSVPTSGKRLTPYLGLPVLIPVLRRLIGPAIARVRIPL
jgi:hypothetical protein